MATHPHHIHETDRPRLRAAHEARVRRWCWAALVVSILLTLYAGSLAWAVREIGAGVQGSLQPLPALMRDNPATD